MDVWVRYGKVYGVAHTRKVCGRMHGITNARNVTMSGDLKSCRELSKCIDIIVRTCDVDYAV